MGGQCFIEVTETTIEPRGFSGLGASAKLHRHTWTAGNPRVGDSGREFLRSTMQTHQLLNL